MCGFPLSDNYFAWQAFGRQYNTEDRTAVPPYLKAQHHSRLRYLLDRVDTRLAALTETLRQQPDNNFDSFVLLDAMDWMPPDAIAALWDEIARVGEPGARVIFRTASRLCPLATARSESPAFISASRPRRPRPCSTPSPRPVARRAGGGQA